MTSKAWQGLSPRMSERDYGIEHWSSPVWRAGAVTWLDERLAEAGLTRTGEVRQPHLRPWATALAAPTSAGTVWLKAAGPVTAFEVGLYELLARIAPDDILMPIAVDVARGWVLLPDGGTPLRGLLSGDELVDAFAGALRRYGALQRTLAPHTARLLELGLADMRPAALPGRFDEAVQAVRAFVETSGSEEDREPFQRAAGMGDEVAAWCEQLADAPGVPTLDHNDLHTRNVLLGGAAGDRALVYDWGDSVVAHPFASMLVPLSFMQRHVLSCGSNDPRLMRLRDAYLGAFEDLAEPAELVATLELACRAGKIVRALTWDRVLRSLHPADVDESWRRTPLDCLASLTEAGWIGSW